MISYDIIAYFLAANAIIYIAIHLLLEIISYRSKEPNQKEDSGDYDIWERSKPTILVSILSTFYFWIFFTVWPIYHMMFNSEFIKQFCYSLNYSTYPQIIGLILVVFATTVEILGRIERGKSAISWGVPSELKTGLGQRIVRHPLYASYIYYFIAFQLIFQSLILLPILPGILGYYSIAKYEESILTYEFGDEYRNYQKKVGMLFPLIGRRN
ncbi:MAG: methyltransferase family protein [Thermoplasmata archaeon]